MCKENQSKIIAVQEEHPIHLEKVLSCRHDVSTQK